MNQCWRYGMWWGLVRWRRRDGDESVLTVWNVMRRSCKVKEIKRWWWISLDNMKRDEDRLEKNGLQHWSRCSKEINCLHQKQSKKLWKPSDTSFTSQWRQSTDLKQLSLSTASQRHNHAHTTANDIITHIQHSSSHSLTTRLLSSAIKNSIKKHHLLW